MDDRNAAATKGDIADLAQKFEQLRSEANHGYSDIVKRIADGETRILQAFSNFGESNQQRMTQLEGMTLPSAVGSPPLRTVCFGSRSGSTFRRQPDPQSGRDF
jgi:hypothetical protein